ncbi:hypothetical protein B7494_g4217 [Chlorociboria aeruginascens]|nr:hypothetical protein B7494_g4217 [Chlorociboria aeruginascens]
MTDEEMDREWKPNSARPQSTIARSFFLELDDLFKIDNSIADLDLAVSEKKRAVSTQTSELEALEARLKATEERLKARQTGGKGPSSPRTRTPLGDTFTSADNEKKKEEEEEEEEEKGKKETARPATRGNDKARGPPRPVSSWKQDQPSYAPPPMPGQLPPTPGASEDGDNTPEEKKREDKSDVEDSSESD